MIKTLYPIFQHWSEKGSVYIISDTHFDDEDRKFMGYDISEQDQIDVLKKYCHKNDTLIHLGDVGNPEYMNQLKCYKVLIMGNHDQSVKKFKPYFNEIYPGPLMISEKIILSHEPLKNTTFALNIHGHDHNGKNWKLLYYYIKYGIKPFFYYDEEFDRMHIQYSDLLNALINGTKINCASNVINFNPYNLKDIINSGILKLIKSIHRQIIDDATMRKELDDLFNK